MVQGRVGVWKLPTWQDDAPSSLHALLSLGACCLPGFCVSLSLSLLGSPGVGAGERSMSRPGLGHMSQAPMGSCRRKDCALDIPAAGIRMDHSKVAVSPGSTSSDRIAAMS